MAYHLQKMQENGFKREEMRNNNTFHYRGQDGTYIECENIKKPMELCRKCLSIYFCKNPFVKFCLLTVAICFVLGTILSISILQFKWKNRHICKN